MRGKNDFDGFYLIENVVLKHVQKIRIQSPLGLLLVWRTLSTVVADSVEQKSFSLPLAGVINDDFEVIISLLLLLELNSEVNFL